MASQAPRFLVIDWLENRTRRQRQVVFSLVGLYVVYRLVRVFARVQLDKWWFDSVTDVSVWSTRLWAQIQLAVVFGGFAAMLLGLSVRHIRRVAASHDRPITPRWRSYHERVGPGHRWLMVLFVVFVTYRVGSAAVGQWQQWLLFRHGGNLGVEVDGLGTDLGDHLFKLPFLATAVSLLRRIVIFALVLTLLGHFAAGSLRWPGSDRVSQPAARVHIAFLGMLLAIVQVIDYGFVGRLKLGTNRTGAFDGPGFTELKVTKPVLFAAAIVAVGVGFAAVHYIRTQRLRPLVVSVVGLVALHVIGLAIVPMLVERFIVAPAEAARQLESIENNLLATREAYGLDKVEKTNRTVSDGVDEQLSEVEQAAASRVPLFEQDQMAQAFQVIAGTTGTRVTDVDLDRYTVDGVRRPVLIAARNANRNGLPENGWVQQHLVYTHGDGVVIAPADSTDGDGRPDVGAFDSLLPADDSLYFGENLSDWYVLVGTRREEQNGAEFGADTGIPLHSLYQRAVLSVAMGEPQPLFTAELTSESQLLYRRDIRDRIHALAPFLALDSDPYPVVVDDRVMWVVDAYTTARTYPYAQFPSKIGLHAASDLTTRPFNYLHASAKVVVDALDGTTTIYQTEIGGADDPILDAWKEVFPGLIRPIDEMPENLADHLRYPKDLFVIQSDLLGRYHVEDAETLFNGSQRLAVSAAPPSGVGDESVRPAPATNEFAPTEDSNWVTIRPYGPGASSNPFSTRDELSAFVVGDNDQPERLSFIRLQPVSDRFVSSPLVVQSAIDADPELAQEITLLNANGSTVQYGPMTPLLTTDGVAWVRPLTVQGTSGSAAPRLFGVVTVSNGLVGLGPNPVASLDRVDSVVPR